MARPKVESERWRAIERCVDRALDLEGSERKRYLAGLSTEDRLAVSAWLDAMQGPTRLNNVMRQAESVAHRLLAELATEVRPDNEERHEALSGKRLGSYRLRAALGTGGMGRVFEAERADGAFEQRVAVKILRWELASEQAVERFLRERQILADLDHPGIARLIDGGVSEEGLPFLVMELVHGSPIDRYCDEHRLDLRARLALFLEVLDAVRFAHRRLVIHRDLKPSNILVAPRGEVKLLDFGISKLIGDDDLQLTATGASPLTPGYASPEQIRGEALSTGSDVYSLGVLLHELLVGARPHQREDDSLTELAKRICHDDPPRPSQRLRAAGAENRLRDHWRQLRGDLDAILLRALERDSERRYSTVERLATDLRRFLEHRPIEARPPSAARRVVQWVRRNPAPSVAVFLLLTAGLALFLTTTFAEERRRRTALLAQEFGQAAAEISSRVRLMHRSPLHDIRRERGAIEGQLARLESEVAAAGSLAAGPGFLALGQGYASLGRLDDALSHLLAARDSGWDSAQVLIDLGRLYGRLYLRELEQVRPLRSDLREQILQQARLEFLTPALDYLSAGLEAGAESDLATAQDPLLEALRSFYAQDMEETLAILQRLIVQRPYDEGVLETLIQLRAQRALDRLGDGDVAGALGEHRAAAEPLQQLMLVARSDPEAYRLECERWRRILDLDPAALAEGSGEVLPQPPKACDLMIEIDPDRASSYVTRSSAYVALSELSSYRGRSPRDLHSVCTADALRAIELNPSSADAYMTLGACTLDLASWEIDQGHPEASQLLQQSREAFEQAVSLEPRSLRANRLLANVWTQIGYFRDDRAEPSLAAFENGLQSHQRLVELAPDRPATQANLAFALLNVGMAGMRLGRDPSETFDRAEDTLRDLVAKTPEYAGSYHRLGDVGFQRAEYLYGQGRDPSAAIQGAVEAYRLGLELRPDRLFTWLNLSLVWQLQANYLTDRGLDAGPAVSAALAAHEEVARRRGNGEADVEGGALLQKSRMVMARGGDPEPLFRQVETILRQRLERAEDWRCRENLAEKSRWRVEWLSRQGESVIEEATRGIEEARRALDAVPNSLSAQISLGALHLALAEEAASAKVRRRESSTAAEILSRALDRYRAWEPRHRPLLERARALLEESGGE